MSNKTKINFRQNSYNTSDSGIMFLLALIVPQFVMIVIMLICSGVTGLPFSSANAEAKTFVDVYPTLYIVLAGLVPQISMLASFFIISQRKKIHYAKANQIHVKNFNWLIMLIVLIIGVVCLIGFTPFVDWLTYILKSLGHKSIINDIDLSTAGKFIGAIFYIGVMPAICEELVFRGVIANGLKENGLKIAVILSAIMFAIVHQNLQQLVYQLFLGGVMAYIVLKTGNILYTVIWHFINNVVILTDNHIRQVNNIVTDNSQLTTHYANAWNNIYPILLVIATVCAVIGLLVLLNFVLKKQKATQSALLSQMQPQNNNLNCQQSTNKLDCEQTENATTNKKSNKVIDVLKNPFLLISLIVGIVLWILSVSSAFLS